MTGSENRKIKIGFSPCPNDTFMFDALVHKKIDTSGYDFEVTMDDIQNLNLKAIDGELDVSKISFGVYPLIAGKYEMLTSGSALGKGVGPLFISKKIFSNPNKQIQTVAIPGKNTTAYFLFQMFFPELTEVKEMIFSEIENAILEERVDAGVIIHENRFTYEQKGLKKISDLGELWEAKTKMPIPLGGIAIRRDLPLKIKSEINSLVKKSIQFAFSNPESSNDYVREHAQEMSEEVRNKHINLYVNDFSVDLGEKGIEAVKKLLGGIPANFTTGGVFVSTQYMKI